MQVCLYDDDGVDKPRIQIIACKEGKMVKMKRICLDDKIYKAKGKVHIPKAFGKVINKNSEVEFAAKRLLLQVR